MALDVTLTSPSLVENRLIAPVTLMFVFTVVVFASTASPVVNTLSELDAAAPTPASEIELPTVPFPEIVAFDKPVVMFTVEVLFALMSNDVKSTLDVAFAEPSRF